MFKRVMCLLIAGWFVGSVVASATAQDTGGFGGRRGQRGFGGFQRGQRGQGGFGPGGGMFGGGRFGMGMNAADHNPLTSHVYELIQRPDVQNEINLDLKQKNALSDYQAQIPNMVRQQMQQQMQTMRQNGFGRRGNPNDPNAGGQQDPAQRQQQRQQMQQQMQQMRSDLQNKINQGLTDILRPEQLVRLHQLDLQWRGVMSTADTEVAKETEVTPEHRTAVNGVVTEYQQKVNDARRQIFQQMRADQLAAANGNANTNVRQDPSIAIERADTAARKEGEDKALKLLSAEEKDRWTTALGKPFTFRTDIKTPQR